MSLERFKTNSAELERGVTACQTLKEEKPDPLHWGHVDCYKITPEEATVVKEFLELRQNYLGKEKLLFSLNDKVHDLIVTTGSPVAEALMNEIVSLRLKQKHKDN